jgi:hypothetical protein
VKPTGRFNDEISGSVRGFQRPESEDPSEAGSVFALDACSSCYNDYFNGPGNNCCVRAALESQVLLEKNGFENVKTPWEKFVTPGTTGMVSAVSNLFVNITGQTDPGTDAVRPWCAGIFHAKFPGQELPGTRYLRSFDTALPGTCR